MNAIKKLSKIIICLLLILSSLIVISKNIIAKEPEIVFNVENKEEFIDAISYANESKYIKSIIYINKDICVDKKLTLYNTKIYVKPNVCLTVLKTMTIKDDVTFDGGGEIKRGADITLFYVQGEFNTGNVIFDGGAIWCDDPNCIEKDEHILHSPTDIASLRNESALENIGRSIHNKGIKCSKPLIELSNGYKWKSVAKEGSNTIIQNIHTVGKDNENVGIYVNSQSGSANLENIIFRNNHSLNGRSALFYGWGGTINFNKNIEIYGTMVEYPRDLTTTNVGVLVTNWGFTFNMYNANIHNNSTGIKPENHLLFSGNTAKNTNFHDGTIHDNDCSVFGTHWDDALSIYGGQFLNNTYGFQNSTGGRYGHYGKYYVYGGTFSNKNADITGNGGANFYLYNGNFKNISGNYNHVYIYGDVQIENMKTMAWGSYWGQNRFLGAPLNSNLTVNTINEGSEIYGVSGYTITQEDVKHIKISDENSQYKPYLDKANNKIILDHQIHLALIF